MEKQQDTEIKTLSPAFGNYTAWRIGRAQEKDRKHDVDMALSRRPRMRATMDFRIH